MKQRWKGDEGRIYYSSENPSGWYFWVSRGKAVVGPYDTKEIAEEMMAEWDKEEIS